MVAGAEQPDPVQHGIEVLVAVTDEPRAMPLPAIDALAPVPGVGAQQLLQQRGAQPGHRSADRQLHCDQVGTEDPSAPTASATSRSTSAVNSAAIWSQSPLFVPRCAGRGRRGRRVRWAGLADRLVDRHDLLTDLRETVIVGQLGAHLVHLLDRELPPLGTPPGHRARPQISRPMPGVTLLRAHTIGLAAAAIVLTDRAAPEIAGRGQLVIQSRSPLLQILQRVLAHPRLPILVVYPTTRIHRAQPQLPLPTFVLHTHPAPGLCLHHSQRDARPRLRRAEAGTPRSCTA